ncbi:hypothetical protein L1987_24285 [Smallanthus sonchifolius]|uniref:Uncharacterized protein n=1 Tax=Smallanthus sonchifolius TaxID=185202 RepID=A0ACB9ILH7_9ASTR|nr:hypothetical protein L1987_24285 [Smallanthus sonchifolius]
MQDGRWLGLAAVTGHRARACCRAWCRARAGLLSGLPEPWLVSLAGTGCLARRSCLAGTGCLARTGMLGWDWVFCRDWVFGRDWVLGWDNPSTTAGRDKACAEAGRMGGGWDRPPRLVTVPGCLAVTDIKDATSIEDKELRRTLQSLVEKFESLQKIPKGREVDENNSFMFNDGFTAPFYLRFDESVPPTKTIALMDKGH